jgi:hypothetical protein
MNETFQLVVVGLLVLAAVLYVVRATWKTWFSADAKGCGSGCGKCSSPVAESKPEGRFPLPQV